MIGQAIRAASLLLVAVFALVLVRTRDPARMAIGLSAYGFLVAAMMTAYAAPDVALSQLVVGAVVEPLMLVFALAKVQRRVERGQGERAHGGRGKDV